MILIIKDKLCNTNLMVDEVLFTNLLVALGTIALAIATFVLAIQNRNQLSLLRSQHILQKSHLKPNILVNEFTISGNNIIISLTNSGNNPATEIVLESSFHPMFGLENSFHLIPGNKFNYDSMEMVPAKAVTFLINSSII